MKKWILLTITAALLFALASCTELTGTETPLPSDMASGSPVGGGQGAETPDITPITTAPTEEPASEPPAVEWKTVFTNFLSENYDSISEICFGGIAGVGFIDLDLDGVAELVLFDAGASASMGVQFFDIAENGGIYCVSANISELGKVYGGGYFVDLYVNAGYFDDFRLMEDKQSGERFFLVESGNGAEDFIYRELIRFNRDGDMLVPVSLLYKLEEYELNAESDEMTVVSSRYKRGGEEISADEYNAAREELFAAYAEIDYTPAGIFIWEDKSYDGSLESFMRLVESAIKKYEPISKA